MLIGRDRHGDVGYQYTSDGTISATRVYDPLGAVVAETGALTQIGYQGDYTDTNNGGVWMGARWYQPGTGSFLSRDSEFGLLTTPMSLNRYTYANSDPVGMYDPDGRNACNAVAEEDTLAYMEFLIESGGVSACGSVRKFV